MIVFQTLEYNPIEITIERVMYSHSAVAEDIMEIKALVLKQALL